MKHTILVIFTGLAIASGLAVAGQEAGDGEASALEVRSVATDSGLWARVGSGAPLRVAAGPDGEAQIPQLATASFTVLDAESGDTLSAGTLSWLVDGAPPQLVEAAWHDAGGRLDLRCRGGELLEIAAPGYAAATVRVNADGRRHSVLLEPLGELSLHLEPPMKGRLWLARQDAIKVTRLFASVAAERDIGPDGTLAVRGLARDAAYVGVIVGADKAPVVGSFQGLPSELSIRLEDGLAVSGAVTDLEGQPLGGARIEAMGEIADLDNFRYRQLAIADGEGGFRVAGLLAGRIRVQACAEGRACAEQTVEVVDDEQPPRVVLELAPGHDLQLSVRNEVGDPVSGATVYLQDRLYRTDDRGRLQLTGLPAGATLPLKIFGDGFGLWEGELVTDRRQLEIVVPGGAALEQQVLAAARFAASEVVVRWQAYSESGRRTSSGDGVWDPDAGVARAAGLPAGTYSMSVRLPGSATLHSERVRLAVGEHVVLPAVVPDRGLAVAGRVLDAATMEPVVGARVRCEPGSPSVFRPPSEVESVPSVATDGDGMFLLEGLDPGSCRAIVSAPGYAAWRRDGVEPDETGFDIGDVELDAGMTIVGRVASRDGEPLTGATVEVTESAAYAYFPETTVRTDHDGWFRAERLPVGEWTLTARHAGEQAREEVVGRARETVEVELRLGGIRIDGEVWLGDNRAAGGSLVLTTDGAQAAGMVVMVQRLTVGREIFGIERQPVRFRVGQDGRFSGSGVEAGRYYASYTPPEPGAAPVTRVLEVPPVERFQCAIQYADAAVEGLVVDDDGRAVAGAAVTASAGAGSQDASTFTDADGRFAVRGLEPGRLVLTAHHSDFSPAEPFEVELREGGVEGPVVLELGPPEGASIVLAVQAAAGSTGGAPVYLVGPETATGFTDGGGLATFSGIPAGSYRPCGFAYGGATGCGLGLEVDRGQEVQAQLALGRGGWVDVWFDDASASSKASATPRAAAARAPSVRVLTADGIDISSLLFMASPPQPMSGGVRIGPLQADDYIISVGTETGPRQGQVHVREGEPAALDLG